MFSDETNSLFKEWKKEEALESLMASYAELTKRQLADVEYGDPGTIAEKELALANSRLLSQALLHRAQNLMQVTGAMLLAKNMYGIALTVRGQIETTAVLGYFAHRIRALQNGHIDQKTYCNDTANVLTGARHEFFEQAKAPANIITCVEKADKFLDSERNIPKKKIIADLYGWLSEFAHPNYSSNACAFYLDKEKHRMVLRKDAELTEEHFHLIDPLVMSSLIFIDLFDQFTSRVDKQLA